MKHALIGVALLAACSATDVTGLREAVPYDSPALLPLWEEIEACSGLRGDFSKIRFYTTPKIVLDGRELNGLWWPATNSIYLLDAVKNSSIVIKHEVMHALLRSQKGEEVHPAYYFVSGPCGNLIPVWW